ncbi:pancreatic triacylglycerol lipase-like [Anthonomus grandis grandis]|uniref:pancreatic triacylglycerol lipase-like n=1 Tax=Anthonomus grandis grandis TaxID=2921223 RepID=UPI0021654919|nr:pancreatic triacylglycerol lipase-like [Anthonomus grandis grandis]XP_050314360.1 pancreatic triacylglycerol lipase-like [Anthonomus grandis grandis]XP_050314361.1 pancreatic triacylglycerol lipase-like [Anthonomus grandis grandis]
MQRMIRMSYVSLIVVMFIANDYSLAGILDVNWSRSDKAGIEVNFNLPWLPFENETRCYDDLGCLNITRSWYHLVNRPFNVFPLPRSVINTKFILYTRLNPSEGQLIKATNESIDKSSMNVDKKIKFIIHGFIDTPLSNWVKDMRTELLKAEDLNVIVVDWAGGSLPLYTQATANTRLVGLEVAYLINFLVNNFGVSSRNVHIIGHSLGAHTAGYAGTLVPGLGRITGLDPAEPYFQGMPAHVRLDPSDAELVDVIHTDGKGILFLGYGMSQPCGHLDFYPNDGKEQPGCDITQTPLVPLTLIRDGLEEASRVLVACNHVRAIKLFIDSINTQCPYIGRQCSSFKQFMSGKCFGCKSGISCAIMGYKADSSLGYLENEVEQPHAKLQEAVGNKYFLATGRDYPFCQQVYRVSVDLAKPSFAEEWVQGRLKLSMYGPNGVIQTDLAPAETKLEHGTTYVTVIAHPLDLAGNIRKVELNWAYDMNVLEPKSLCLFWCNDHLYVRSVIVDQLEMPGRGKRNAKFSNRLCSKRKEEYVDIASTSKGMFWDTCATERSDKG